MEEEPDALLKNSHKNIRGRFLESVITLSLQLQSRVRAASSLQARCNRIGSGEDEDELPTGTFHQNFQLVQQLPASHSNLVIILVPILFQTVSRGMESQSPEE